jgi:cation:H+ antiporter
MSILIAVLMVGLGLLLLTFASDWLVEGASALAKRLKVSDLVIGLTIVAFGTSAPELVVSVVSAWQGNVDISLANVIGSNIFNILAILGIAAIIYPLSVTKSTIWKEIPFSLLAVIVLGFLVNGFGLDAVKDGVISGSDAMILLSFFVIFLYYVYGMARNAPVSEAEGLPQGPQMSLKKAAVWIVCGLIGLVIGGKFTVDGAVTIATWLGVSQTLIGLTIVAAGTSLPELATSVQAARKKKDDIAVGNIVGSNIFNIFFILGVAGLIRPLPINSSLVTDMAVASAATFVLFASMFIGRKHKIDRWQGIGYLLLYVAYVVYLIVRG